MEDVVYGVILEWKNDGPLIMEGKLTDYETAHNRIEMAMRDPKVIRACIFQAVYRAGNETLLPKEDLCLKK